MGFRGVPSADIYLDNVQVPVGNIVVPAGGFARLMEAFDLERCGNATMALAQASGALEDVWLMCRSVSSSANHSPISKRYS